MWLDNIIKCHPPGNRDPHSDEILECTRTHLLSLIFEMRPTHIITMGRVSTRWVLGDVDMEMVHGIPRPYTFVDFDHEPHEAVVIPTYHPAAGLHDPTQMILFQSDMQIAGDVIRDLIPPHPPVDEWEGRERYHGVREPADILAFTKGFRVVAVDTEWARGEPWCLSLSITPGEALVVRADQTDVLDTLNAVLNYPNVTTVIHNALYDLPVLDRMGIRPRQIADTMVMAYLLQNEPQGLKPLAFRHCGMVMSTYSDMVGDATRRKALAYLEAATQIPWPNPDPVLEWAKGEPKVRTPQNISRKIAALLKRVDKGADPYQGWRQMSDTQQVEGLLGPLTEADLSDIPLADAIRYSARDADATLRVYPILWGRIEALGLADTFWRDMRAMPMVVDMMANGMPVDLEAFGSLSAYFQGRMDEIQGQMQELVGEELDGIMVNPASYPQMSTLIYDKLRLHESGGRFKSKKGAVNKSTADDILKRYLDLHPCVQMIIDWRGYQKLKTSYADAIPRKVSPDGRIRTTLRMTRVATGRLSSSEPNLMAQPTRSDEGRKVRDCYRAPEGWKLVSGDYSQVEMRVAANDSRDDRMLEIFLGGADIHAQTASWMFGIPVDQLDEMEHRYPAKRVGFGILNLITAEGLQRELEVGGAHGWTVRRCEDMIRSWFDIFRGVARYMKANGEQAKRFGYVRDMWGRLRYIPGIRSQNKWVRLEAERQAGNAPIQMGAQGIIKEAMGRLVPEYRRWDGAVRPLIQIHDDIVWEIRDDVLDEALGVIKRVMEESTPSNFLIPLGVDFKVGERWGSMTKTKISR